MTKTEKAYLQFMIAGILVTIHLFGLWLATEPTID